MMRLDFFAYTVVFLGGGIGSALRYGIAQFFAQFFARHSQSLPYGTLCANVLASAALSALMIAALRGYCTESQRLLIGVGFCGGLSTFSTFSYETILLLQQARYLTAAFYVLATLCICGTTMWLILQK